MGRPSLTVNLKSYFYFIFKRKKKLVNYEVDFLKKISELFSYNIFSPKKL